uniref:HNH endonuclease n=1 Tax=Mimivirus LCMiAC01 TaxID=2506608 RepID=A0A481Z0Q4_9VIRU|nr:MAG: HNH endonuclease [Mimivirus LCMiAC01]
MVNEIWKDINGYEKKYQISSLGKCRNKLTNEIMNTCKTDGIERVHLKYNNKCYQKCVHRLLAIHFIENPNNYKYIHHIDGNKLNNNLKNLMWVPNTRTTRNLASQQKYKKNNTVNKKNTNKKQNVNNINDTEIWRDIDGYDIYMISNLGRIKNKNTNRILKLQLNKGYYVVTLYNKNKKSKQVTHFVHRLIAKAFIENKENKKVVDHINNIKTDNRAINLRYATHSQNTSYYYKNYRKKEYKPVLQCDLNSKLIKEWDNVTDIFDQYNYDRSTIYDALCGNNKTAYGYTWKYKNKIKTNKIVIEKDEVFKNVSIIDGCDFTNYDISNYGKVKSYNTNKYLKPDKKHYLMVKLYDKNTKKQKAFYVHRLVALKFINGRTKKKNTVNHKDHNIKNNYYKNLEWMSIMENNIHGGGKKVKQIDIKTNQIINTYMSMGEAVRKLKLPFSAKTGISKCCKGKGKTAYGYKWEYA